MSNIIWHKIFNKKNFSYNTKSKKIKTNGFFNKSYKLTQIVHPGVSRSEFKNILKYITKSIQIEKNTSILDFGSGNGGLLYFFIKKYNLKENISLEISKPLLDFQKKFIKNTIFIKTSHKNNNFLKKKKIEVQNSISMSVFQYFYSQKYCSEVLKFLLDITKENILIYDLKDSNKKKQYIDNVIKRQKMNLQEYNKKYKNTPIRFYSKNFFIKTLGKLKKKYKFSYKFEKLPLGAIDRNFGYCLKIRKN